MNISIAIVSSCLRALFTTLRLVAPRRFHLVSLLTMIRGKPSLDDSSTDMASAPVLLVNGLEKYGASDKRSELTDFRK